MSYIFVILSHIWFASFSFQLKIIFLKLVVVVCVGGRVVCVGGGWCVWGEGGSPFCVIAYSGFTINRDATLQYRKISCNHSAAYSNYGTV